MATITSTIWRRSAAVAPAGTAATVAAVSSSNAPCVSGQRRYRSKKAFTRYFDYTGSSYYMPSPSNEREPGIPGNARLFEVSDLLMDLDAEDSIAARPMSSEDEKRIKALWAESPVKRAAENRSRAMRKQVTRTREASEIYRKDENSFYPWLLSPYDILNTAIHGARHGRILGEICRTTNIPAHARDDDELLLKWMLLRQQELRRHEATAQCAAPSLPLMIKALKEAKSLADVRRVIFEGLDAGFPAQSLEGRYSSWNLPQKLRHVLQQTPLDSEDIWPLKVDTLIFLGNLTRRLADKDVALSGFLYGLGLELSAEIGAVDASYLYLPGVLADDKWIKSPHGFNDVLAALTGWNTTLSLEPDHPALFGQPAIDGQRVLQLMTGLEEGDELSPESLRRLVWEYIAHTTVPANEAMVIYLTYISILGQLGASNTIAAEYQHSLPLLLKRVAVEHESQPDSRPTTDEILESFQAVIQASPRILASGGINVDSSVDLNLVECATMDYHALEPQKVVYQGSAARPQEVAA
jgi:hypothetical protein